LDLPVAEKRRRLIGLFTVAMGVLAGAVSLLVFFVVVPVSVGRADMLLNMVVGAVLAFPAGAVYLTFPRLLDRYDPEPWYALIGCLLWGGVGACGFAVLVNSLLSDLVASAAGAEAGDVFGAVVSAPIVEEGLKAIGVYGVFYFLRREFDGVVDGVIYATFVAIGFATVENVVYYANAASTDALGITFFLRGIIAPWGHPVYTSMFGLGLGVAREAEKFCGRQ
jgi:RsiW-degrading membrane proteinase PrsW (M82 family)